MTNQSRSNSREELKARPGGCEEASLASQDFYIPCNKGARFMIKSRDGTLLRMCYACADHNVTNRGAKHAGPFIEPFSAVDTGVRVVGIPEEIRDPVTGNPFDIPPDLSPKTNPAIQKLMDTAQELINQESVVSNLDESLKQAKAILNGLKTQTMPLLMSECGMSTFTHEATGAEISISDFVSGSLPKEPEPRARAFAEIKNLEGESLIKTTITIEYGKDEYTKAKKLFDQLKAKGLNIDIEIGIHPQTYLAFAREAIKNGAKISLEALGLFAGRTTKVDWPKEKKTRKVK